MFFEFGGKDFIVELMFISTLTCKTDRYNSVHSFYQFTLSPNVDTNKALFLLDLFEPVSCTRLKKEMTQKPS